MFHQWKFSDLVRDLNYVLFSHPNPYPNSTYLPKHEFVSPNNQFYQRIWYVEHSSVNAYMVWSQKFRKSEISLDTGYHDFRLYQLRAEREGEPDDGPWHPRRGAFIWGNCKTWILIKCSEMLFRIARLVGGPSKRKLPPQPLVTLRKE